MKFNAKKETEKIIEFIREYYKKFLFKSPSDGLSGKTDEDKLGVKYKDIVSVMEGKKVTKEIKSKIDKLHTNSLHKFNIPVCNRK